MCGLFGIIFHGEKHVEQRYNVARLFCYLALDAMQRGTDATGLARIEADGYSLVYKNIVPAYDIVGFRRWQKPLLNLSPTTQGILGHTRFGTHGANTIPNAHPFRIKGSKHTIIGTHNGVIGNYLEFGPKPAFDNDSANLFYALAHTPKAGWSEVLGAIRGSFALVWSDGNNIYMARNSSSPCVLTYVPELDATVYASTEDILRGAFGDSKLYSLGGIRHLPIGELHTFRPKTLAPIQEEFEPKYTSIYSSAAQSYAKFLSRPSDDALYVCDTCGKESETSVWEPATRGYECSDCQKQNTTTVGKVGKLFCDFCQADRLTTKYCEDILGRLCAPCRKIMGIQMDEDELPVRERAKVLVCENCSMEVHEALEGTAIFFLRESDGYYCNDCVSAFYTTLASD